MKTVDIEDLERLATFKGSGASRKGPTREAVLALWGGYQGPHWRIDRRPKPLRDRRTLQRYITSLRRLAVLKLWGHGLSFRQIGRRLGISHVAAWKLWWQVYNDQCEYGRAIQLGHEVLDRAQEEAEQGDGLLLLGLEIMADEHFGMEGPPLD